MFTRIVRSAPAAAASLVLLGGCAGYVTNVYAPERISALVPEEGRVILSVGAPPARPALVAQFDRSLQAASPYIQRRLQSVSADGDRDIVVSLARHACLSACPRLDAPASAECERHRGPAEDELSRILAEPDALPGR